MQRWRHVALFSLIAASLALSHGSSRAQEAETQAPAPAAEAAPSPASASSPASTPVKAEVTAGEHEGFARIVFALPSKVGYEAKIDGHTLKLHFAAPVAADLSAIPRRVSAYVESATMAGDADVEMSLRRDVALRAFDGPDRKIVIDLQSQPDKPAAAAHSEPAATAAKEPTKQAAEASAGEKVAAEAAAEAKPTTWAPPVTSPTPTTPTPTSPTPVKVTDEPGGRRLAFEWPQHVDFSVDVTRGIAELRFRNAPALDADRFAADAADLAPKISSAGKETTVAFKLPPGTHLRANRQGNHVVVDIAGMKPAAKPAAAPTKVADTPATTADAAALAPVAAAAPAPSAMSAPAAVAPPISLLPTSGPSATPAVAPAAAPLAAPVAALAAAPVATPSAGAAGEGAIATPAANEAATEMSLRDASDDEGATLRFEWSKPVGAALFRRGEVLWIVFGEALPVDLAALRNQGHAAIRDIEQVPHASATVLRVRTVGDVNPSIRRSGTAWVVALRPQLLQPASPVGLNVQAGAAPPRVFFAVREPGQPIVIRDPEIGDTLVAVPVLQVAQGLAREARFVDFTAMLTAQGVAVRPESDAVVVKSLANGVEVTSTGGLSLSSDADRERRRSENGSGIFNLKEWFGPEDAEILAQARKLEQSIVAGPPAARSPTRLDLAHFYFARGFAAEALGVIGVVQRDDPNAAADPAVRALDGGAKLLAGDLDGADQALNLPVFDDDKEIALWRGSLAYARHDWPRANTEFAKGAPVLRHYPKPLRNRFAREAAEAALATGMHDDANDYIALVLRHQPSPTDRASAELLSARSLALSGDTEKADTLYGKLAASDVRRVRAEAAMSRALDDLEGGTITRPEAIQKLDGLRFAWRDDDFELNLLHHLGELKIKDGDYRGGFEALHEAIANYPDHPERPAIQQALSDAFAEIYLGSDAESVPPLKSLALYNEFKELSPSGPKGDEIISKLADRLVSIDLLDRAGDLLEGQVRNRLQGREKARVATRVALVRLLDRKPQAALDALDIDVGNGADAGLQRQRQQLRARALIELGRMSDALASLGDDNSRDADRLRADVAWRSKNWGEATKVLSRLATAPELGGKLDDDAARIILNLGTSMTLAGDKVGVTELGRRYGAAMEGSPYRDAFRVIAGGSLATGGDIRQIAGKVAQLDDLQSFISGYKQKLQSGKLSTVN